MEREIAAIQKKAARARTNPILRLAGWGKILIFKLYSKVQILAQENSP
jgi:hypothetical protein